MWRSAIRSAAAIVFCLQFVAVDLIFRRGDRFHPLAFVESALSWALFLGLATTRRRRLALALSVAALLVAQLHVFRFFGRALDLQVAEAARHQWSVVRPVVVRMLPQVGMFTALAFVIEALLLELAARPRWDRVSFGVAFAGLFSTAEIATADACALRALGAFRRERLRPVAGAVTLPRLDSERAELPDVLFVLTESVRAEDYTAETAPLSRKLGPRVELAEMRAVSSYTVLSLSALLTGRSQEADRGAILGSPSLFDFAHAAGAHVSYYSGHSKEIFEAKEVYAAVDRFVSLETIAGRDIEDDADLVTMPLDRMLVDRFIAEMPGLSGKAFVSVLHLASTHAPYYVDDARAPFRPYDRVVAWSKMKELRNAYKNAILEQDAQVARAVDAFVARAGRRPWIVVFTSDHGEAFGEHGAIHHGQNLFDEQIHVPAWIASSFLSDAETRALRDQRFVTHLDLLPTMLDALGVWNAFAVQAHRDAMGGRSLLRPVTTGAPVPFTNCTAMFRCPLNTWGMLGDDRKLVAQGWDASWSCLGLHGGEHALPPEDAGCTALREASRRYFPAMPNGAPNR